MLTLLLMFGYSVTDCHENLTFIFTSTTSWRGNVLTRVQGLNWEKELPVWNPSPLFSLPSTHLLFSSFPPVSFSPFPTIFPGSLTPEIYLRGLVEHCKLP